MLLHSLVVALTFLPAAEPDPVIRFASEGDSVKVVARLPESLAGRFPPGQLEAKQGEAILRVALLSETNEPGQALLGRYSREGELLSFVPRFPLAAGQRYRASLLIDGRDAATADYAAPAPITLEPLRVEAIFPTSDKLPANLLKLYIQFSRPMREGPALFDHIHILDDAGKPVEDPWRRTELWNAEATRLTLWIHPGRIKRGVNLREEFGPVLHPDRNYTLVLGGGLIDSSGQKLGKPVTKRFRTTAAILAPIAVNDWTRDIPESGTRKPLIVRFPQPLDRVLLATALEIRDARGQTVAGQVHIGDQERSWSFTPRRPWPTGAYTFVISALLEDQAGNTPLRAFDFDRNTPKLAAPKLVQEFHVK